VPSWSSPRCDPVRGFAAGAAGRRPRRDRPQLASYGHEVDFAAHLENRQRACWLTRRLAALLVAVAPDTVAEVLSASECGIRAGGVIGAMKRVCRVWW